MSPELMYQKFLVKINRNNTQFDIACDRQRFVLIINEAKNRWVEKHLKEKDSILIDSLQQIIKDEALTTGVDKETYIEYEIAGDFYEAILAKCEAERDDCKRTIFSREVKNQDKNILYFDDFQRPDFDYEWTFHSIQANTIRIYKTDFKITEAVLEYYSVIPEVTMEGTIDIEGNTIIVSQGIDILSDQYVDQIINVAAEEFERDFKNEKGLTIAKDRTNSQE